MQITIVIDSFEELDKLRKVLRGSTEEVAPVEVQPMTIAVNVDKEPAAKKGKRAVDSGKIRALHAAGWSAKKIADEMRCSVATVYNHLA